MRLAFLVIHSCPDGIPGGGDTGGMNVYVKKLAIALGLMGDTVDIYTRQHLEHSRFVESLATNVRLIHIPDGNVNMTNKLEIFKSLPVFLRNLQDYVKYHGLKYDMLCSHYWISGSAGLELQTGWQIPHVTMFHTIGKVKNSFATQPREPEIRLETEKSIAEKTDFIIATTPEEKKLLQKEFGVDASRVSIIPCGVDLQLFHVMDKAQSRTRLQIDPLQNLILYAGRLDKIKGIECLLQACLQLQSTNFSIYIVGGNESDAGRLADLQKYTGEHGIQNRVIFQQAVPQETLKYYYNAANVFVLPSYSESFGLAALEALACGTPVVATSVGAMNDVIRKDINGRVVTDNNPALLAQAIDHMLQLSPGLDRVKIRQTVKDYDYSIIGLKMKEIYSSIAST